MLKLVINNTQPLYAGKTTDASLTLSPKDTFFVNFQQTSHNLFSFTARESEYDLTCKMNVEIKESYAYADEEGMEEGRYLVPIAFCNFPGIDTQRLKEKVCWDEYLQGNIMVQFQLKILEQLLLFCEENDVPQLVITINDVIYDELEIYRHFALSEVQDITAEGEQTKIIIPTDVETYDETIDFMDKFDADFCKTLWRHQKSNPVFRRYLMDHSLSV